ncbi:SDR family oxidoreductase [Allokutzneria sp. NRRL B-24872]|uniref:SDR family oxidoreductase n=1 Tax=Allokutzneria sp. NRRL B-24872 TaxID=1137961 RepID=UPI00143D926B|nr:SDR family oxidoreductase [Allokutzneria sp. NRRL B-24872]
MTVAVTGATGFLGLRLVRELLERHTNLLVLAHVGSPDAVERIGRFLELSGTPRTVISTLPDRVRVVEVELTEPRMGLSDEDYEALAAELEVLWHCAGGVDPSAGIEALRLANVTTTRTVLDLLDAAPRKPLLHYVSSAFVAGSRRDGVIEEGALDDLPGFENAYERSKHEAETAVRAWAEETFRPVVVHRPSLMITDEPAPGELWSHPLLDLVRAGKAQQRRMRLGWLRLPRWLRPTVRLVGHEDARLNFIPVADAAAAMATIADSVAENGPPGVVQTYHVVHGSDVPVQAVVSVLEKNFPLRVKLVPQPPHRMRAVERVTQVSSLEPYLSHRRTFDDARARSVLGPHGAETPIDLDYLLASVRTVGTGPRKLGPLDRVYLDYDAGHPNSAELGGLLRFAGRAPSVEELREYIAARVARVPDLSLALGAGRDWQRRDELDLSYHVREIATVGETGDIGLRSVVEDVLGQRLARTEPLWQLWLIHGYRDGEYTVLFKPHHALLDGASAEEALYRLLDDEAAESEPPKPWSGRPRVLRSVLSGVARYLRGFRPVSARPFSVRGLTGERRVWWTTVGSERLHRAARLHRVTVNEIYLAALSGMLREWPGMPWRTVPERMWALVPMTVGSSPGPDELGNHSVPLRVELPCDEPDPLKRLARVRASSIEQKNVIGTTRGMRSLPTWLVRLTCALTFSRWHVDLMAGNSRWTREVDLFGAEAIGSIPIGMLHRDRPIGVFLGTHGETASLCVVTDSALPASDGLDHLWAAALDELAPSVRTTAPVWAAA